MSLESKARRMARLFHTSGKMVPPQYSPSDTTSARSPLAVVQSAPCQKRGFGKARYQVARKRGSARRWSLFYPLKESSTLALMRIPGNPKISLQLRHFLFRTRLFLVCCCNFDRAARMWTSRQSHCSLPFRQRIKPKNRPRNGQVSKPTKNDSRFLLSFVCRCVAFSTTQADYLTAERTA